MDLINLEPVAKPTEAPVAIEAPPKFNWVGSAAITGRTRVYGGTSKPEIAEGSIRLSMEMPDFARLRSRLPLQLGLPDELDRPAVWVAIGVAIAVITVVLGLLIIHAAGGPAH